MTIEERRAYYRKRYAENREYCLEKSRQWKLQNQKRCQEYREEWRAENKEKWNEMCREYASKNIETIRAYQRSRNSYRKNYQSKRRKTDIQFRLAGNLRSRLNQAVRKGNKAGSAIKDLGCGLVEFKHYIEEKWSLGMTWNNYGDWQLDHIIPLASFDLTDKEQFHRACHYTNYQPLWSIDNMRKGGRQIKDIL